MRPECVYEEESYVPNQRNITQKLPENHLNPASNASQTLNRAGLGRIKHYHVCPYNPRFKHMCTHIEGSVSISDQPYPHGNAKFQNYFH